METSNRSFEKIEAWKHSRGAFFRRWAKQGVYSPSAPLLPESPRRGPIRFPRCGAIRLSTHDDLRSVWVHEYEIT